MAIKAINPVSGKVFASYDEMTPTVVSGIISDVHEAFLTWRRTSFAERATMMREAAEILRGSAGDYARLMAQEMGKPVRDGVAEVEKCASGCDFYAENAVRFLAREPILTEARNSFVTFNPLGVVLAVMPWNFPFWQVFRFAAPGLMAGNAAVLKHASNVPGCALAIEDVFRRAGFPKNLFRTLMIGSPQVPSVIEYPLVRAVTLTGSGPAGRAVAGKAGQMLKKTVLELGGSDPYLVLEDADLELAATVSTKGRLVNAGQSCIAAKRFIVAEKARRPFEELFVQKMGAVKMGDPLKEDTQIGPLARHDLRDELHRQVEASIAGGARCLLGGAIPNNPGAYYPPTVLTDVRRGCRLIRKSSSDRSPPSFPSRTRKRRSRLPTIQRLGWAAASSPATWRAASTSLPNGLRVVASSSTKPCAPIRAFPSAASRKAATDGSFPSTASKSL
jgi:succinate-semialdehyde dehydrogenase/glutarate-semialdehyde dehydrogenase